MLFRSVAPLPVRNKTPPPSRGLVNQIGRLVRGPAARVPPLPHNDVWSTDRVSLWERVGVRAKTPRAWGRTYWFVPPLDLQPQTTVHRVHHQRRGSPDLRVRPLRAHPHTTTPWAAHDIRKSCPEGASDMSRGSSEANTPGTPPPRTPAPRTGCQNAGLAPRSWAESDRAVTDHVFPCGSPCSPLTATSLRMGKRWRGDWRNCS